MCLCEHTPTHAFRMHLPHAHMHTLTHSHTHSHIHTLMHARYAQRGKGIKYPEVDRLGGFDDGKVPSGAPDPRTAADLEEVDAIVHKDPLYKLKPRDIELLRKYK